MKKLLHLIALGLLVSCGEARTPPSDPGPLTEADDPVDPGTQNHSEADNINAQKML